MWKQKIGMSIRNDYKIPTVEVVRMLAHIGFDAISPAWEEGVDLEEIVGVAHACKMEVQSLHAPYWKMAGMWSDDPSLYEPAMGEVLQALEECYRLEIPVMVMHAWVGHHYTFQTTEQGFQNFQMIIEKAKAYGVQIAFENTEGLEYLRALFARFGKYENVGFCWDSGHEICYNHCEDLLAEFGDKLIMTHLNDNIGMSNFDGTSKIADDCHLLPYDGIADWDYNIERLRKLKKQEILNFELKIRSKSGRYENTIYEQMPLELYFTEAYKRTCKVAYRYSK